MTGDAPIGKGRRIGKGRGRPENKFQSRGSSRRIDSSIRLAQRVSKWSAALAHPPRRDRSSYAVALRESRKVRPQFDVVLRNLNKSAKSGDPRACWALYTWHRDGIHVEQSMTKAIELLRRAASKHLPEALFDLAVHHERGVGVSKNMGEAFRLYLRAALHGDSQAVREIGRCYYYGIGVARDRRVADIWLRHADALGIPE